MLNETTVTTMATPGNTTTHHAGVKVPPRRGRSSPSRRRRRRADPEVRETRLERDDVADGERRATIIGAITLGSRCRNPIRTSEAPRARAEAT